jgi:hypothetical protein
MDCAQLKLETISRACHGVEARKRPAVLAQATFRIGHGGQIKLDSDFLQ